MKFHSQAEQNSTRRGLRKQNEKNTTVPNKICHNVCTVIQFDKL